MRDLHDPFHIALSAFSAFLCDCVIFFVSEFSPHTLVGIYNLLFFGSDSSKYLTLHLSKTKLRGTFFSEGESGFKAGRAASGLYSFTPLSISICGLRN